MPPTVQAALLGIVQGVTEFLPVSSSAHLILARAFFGYDATQFGLPFDVAVHLGTALAVAMYFRTEIARLLAALPAAFSLASAKQLPTPLRDDVRLIWLIVVGTIPIVVIGTVFDDVIEEHLRTPAVAAATLTVGAILFFAVERLGAHARDERSLTLTEAIWIGCAQAAALVPGVSRSGAAITMALFLGLRRADSARFVFLLGLPAMAGAAMKELPGLAGGDSSVVGLMVVGVLTSAVIGYLAIRFFIRYVATHSLDAFAWYRLALAAAVVIWLIAGRV